MIRSSRPLRFLALLLLGWVTMRTMQLWPETEARNFRDPQRRAAVVGRPFVAGRDASGPSHRSPLSLAEEGRLLHAAAVGFRPSVRRTGGDGEFGTRPETIGRGSARPSLVPPATLIGSVGAARPRFDDVNNAATVAAAAPTPASAVPQVAVSPQARLHASLWMIIRNGAAASPLAPQLGGSQAGARLTYTVDGARRVSLAGRLSTALGSRQREAAIGIDWQPTTLPVHLIAEQRIGIDGVRGGPSIGVIAGVGPLPLAAGFRFEAYGQAGGIRRGGAVGGYADGAVRMMRPLASVGITKIDAGLGVWGAAQPGAARVDIGPSAGVALPIAGKALRFSLDWRQRVAGNARPGSGPVFSIGTDF